MLPSALSELRLSETRDDLRIRELVFNGLGPGFAIIHLPGDRLLFSSDREIDPEQLGEPLDDKFVGLPKSRTGVASLHTDRTGLAVSLGTLGMNGPSEE